MRRFLPLLLAATACSKEIIDLPPLVGCEENAKPTAGYLVRSELESRDWYYRRTIVETELPFTGAGDLARVRFALDGDELNARASGTVVASFQARALELECVEGAWTEKESASGSLLVIDLSTRSEAVALAPIVEGLAGGFTIHFNKNEELAPWRRATSEYLELTERGELTANLEACDAFVGGLEPPLNCGGAATMRHSFAPIDRVTPRPLIFYRGVDAPESNDVAAALHELLPSFELRANSCSLESLMRAAGERAELATLLTNDPLVELCNSFEQAAPDIFTWQRAGDLRFSTISTFASTAMIPWGSYTARAMDPESGEIVAADLMIDMSFVEDVVGRVTSLLSGDPGPRALMAIAKSRAEKLAGARYRIPSQARVDIERLATATTTAEFALSHYAQVEGTNAEDIAKSELASALLLGPDYRNGDPVPSVVYSLVTPRERMELFLDAGGREVAASLLGAGYDQLTRFGPHGYEFATLELVGMTPEDAELLIDSELVAHLYLHGLGHALGLTDNPAASSDVLNFPIEWWDGDRFRATSSVMDLLPGDIQLHTTTLGRADVAALRAKYFGEVEVFEAPLPSDLRFAGPEAYRAAAASRRNFVRATDAPDSLRVPYAYCSLTLALEKPTPSCAAFDYGATAREIFADKYARWSGQYFVTNVVDRSRPFNPRFAMRGAIDIVGFGSISAAHLAHLETSEPSFVDSDREHDLFDAISMTANFVEEVLGIPGVGRMCPWPGQGSYIPGEYVQQPGCDETTPIDGPEAQGALAIELRPGVGRDIIVERARNSAPWTRIGSELDRLDVLLSIGFPFPTDLPADARRATIPQVLPVISEIFHRALRVEPALLSGQAIEDIGSWWCRDSEDSASIGHVEPRRALDEHSDHFPRASAECNNPATIDFGVTHGVLEAALVGFFMELDHSFAIYKVGTDDQLIDWSAFTPDQLCSVDLGNDGEYRALIDDDGAECAFIQHLQEMAHNVQADPSNPLYRGWYDYDLFVTDRARTLRSIYR